MANSFSKRNDPQVVNNLSSDHANVNFSKNSQPSYKAQTFDKKDSSSFKQANVLYQSNVNLVPDYEKYRKRKVEMPEAEYTEEKVLARPIADKDAPLRIEKKETEVLSFNKSADVNNMQFTNVSSDYNPVDEVFQNAKTTSEEIPIIEDAPITIKPKKKNNLRKKIMPWIIGAVVLELVIVLVLSIAKYYGKIDVLECTQQNYNDFYGATITNTKKYTFKSGKITKLLDTTVYSFDDKTKYNAFKKEYAYPEYNVIKGRIVSFNINDNINSYEEKITYDYKALRKQDKNEDKHTITIESTKENDRFELIDYNIKDIKIIYSEDYTCR